MDTIPVIWHTVTTPFIAFLIILIVGGVTYVATVESNLDLRRVLRASKRIATSHEIPRWLRWLFIFGLMPVPLFLDEAALLLAIALVAIFHRSTLRRAWEES